MKEIIKNIAILFLRFFNLVTPKEKNSLFFKPHSNCKNDNYDIINYHSDNVLTLFNSILNDERFKYYHISILVYDIDNQDVYAGGSGCACCAIVMYSYVYKKLINNEIKRVLIIATGALMNPIMTSQKESIPSIAHAIALESVVE